MLLYQLYSRLVIEGGRSAVNLEWMSFINVGGSLAGLRQGGHPKPE